MKTTIPKYVLVDDDNYRLCNPCESEAEARAQAEFNFNDEPIRHVFRVCPECGEHEVARCNSHAYGIETSFWFCHECAWTGDPE